jgi:hypothetical protein
MVMTKPELIASLQHEVRILLHLASKVDGTKLDYRPTAKQRSTMELLQYLSFMGPEAVKGAKAGAFDTASWTSAEEAAATRNFDETLEVIARQADDYASQLGDMTDADFREQIEMFGQRTSRGAFLVNVVLCGCAAYRTQLFCYLKSCGREELNTMNLWAGMDAMPTAV